MNDTHTSSPVTSPEGSPATEAVTGASTNPNPHPATDGTADAHVITADCLAFLPTLPDHSVHLVATDPPFNIGLKYPGYDDNRPPKEYLDWLGRVFNECRRVLAPDGSLFTAIGPKYQAELLVLLKSLGYHWRDTIVWHYTFGSHQKKKFTPAYTPIHYVTVHPTQFTFNADAVRVPSARQTVYKDKRANPLGRIPDNVWAVPRVCGTFKERVGNHVCQMPEAVLERIVLAASHPNDLVLDPFAGTGTTLAAAVKHGRRSTGTELCPATADLASRRLNTSKVSP